MTLVAQWLEVDTLTIQRVTFVTFLLLPGFRLFNMLNLSALKSNRNHYSGLPPVLHLVSGMDSLRGIYGPPASEWTVGPADMHIPGPYPKAVESRNCCLRIWKFSRWFWSTLQLEKSWEGIVKTQRHKEHRNTGSGTQGVWIEECGPRKLSWSYWIEGLHCLRQGLVYTPGNREPFFSSAE